MMLSRFQFSIFFSDLDKNSNLTRILSHPTMEVSLTAGDDRRIRYFDNKSGIEFLLFINIIFFTSSVDQYDPPPPGVMYVDLDGNCNEGRL